MGENYLEHHGILGQKWGVRRYQNPDGSLTEAGKRRLARQDTRWAKKNEKKITKYAMSKAKPYADHYAKYELGTTPYRLKSGKVSKTYINAYNRKLADLMTKSVSGLESPSGKVVAFVAKRGTMGVMMAIADKGYDFGNVKNGVWENGRVAYKKNSLDRIEV